MSNKANETANQNLVNGTTPEGNENPKGGETVKKENVLVKGIKSVGSTFTGISRKHPVATNVVKGIVYGVGIAAASFAVGFGAIAGMDAYTEGKRRSYPTMKPIPNSDPVVTEIPTQDTIAIPEQPVSDFDMHEELASAAEVIDNVDTTTF